MSRFDPISFYEAPEVLVGQLLDQEISEKGVSSVISEAFGGAPTATPDERKGLEERLGGNSGNALIDAAVGVATNPLTYLLLLTETPALRGGRLLFGNSSVGSEFVSYLRQDGTVLQKVGAEGMLSSLRGTGVNTTITDLLQMHRDANKEIGGRLSAAMSKLDEAGVAERLNDLDVQNLMNVKLSGFNKGANYSLKRGITKDEAGNIQFKFEEVNDRRLYDLTDEQIDSFLGPEIVEFTDFMRGEMTRTPARVWGKKGATFLRSADDVDGERAFRALSPLQGASEAKAAMAGLGDVSSLVSREVWEEAAKSPAKKAEVVRSLQEVIFDQYTRPNFMPRNIGKAKKFSGDVEQSASARGSILPFSTSVRQRDEMGFTLAPEALDGMRNAVEKAGGRIGEGYNGMAKRAQAQLDSLQEDAEAVKFFVDSAPLQSFNRYVDSMTKFRILYAERASDGAVESLEDGIRRARAGQEEAGKVLGKRLAVMPDEGAVKGRDTSFGGPNNADLLDRFTKHMPDNAVKRQFIGTTLPTLAGKMTRRETLGTHMFYNMQATAGGFVRSPAGESLRDAGGWGRATYDKLNRFSNKIVDAGDNSSFSTALSRIFYAGALGMNPSSVLAQLTQPFTTTIRYADSKNLAAAYKESAQDLSKYVGALGDFVKKNKRMPTKQETVQIRTETLPLTDVDVGGVARMDLLDVTDPGREVLDHKLRNEILEEARRGVSGQRIGELMMGPFLGGEILNRNVTARTLIKQAGFKSFDDVPMAQRREVAQSAFEGTAETQFGSNAVNTPTMFQDPNSILGNPAIKQFSQFILRMMTSPFTVDARMATEFSKGLGGTTGRAFQKMADATGMNFIQPTAANNFLRAVGVSAVGVEVFKAAINTDISRYGVIDSTLEIPLNMTDDRGGPLPLPPVITVGAEAAKFLTLQDNEFMRRGLPLFVPGGLAISRALDLAPEMGEFGEFLRQDVGMQRQFVGWGEADEEGNVPVYDSRGYLRKRENGMNVLLRGLGFDPTGRSSEGKETAYILSMTDQIREYKRRAEMDLLKNNYAGFERTKREFQQRFGMELKIDSTGLERRKKNATTPLNDRVLKNIGRDYRRELFAPVEGETSATGTTPRTGPETGP